MKVRIDLKIVIFLAIFYFTNQLKIYLMIMFFCLLHEMGHIIAGLLLKMKLEKIEIMPCGLSSSFKANTLDFNKKIKNGNIIELKKIAIALAGPITSFILAIVFTYIDIPNISMQEVVYSNILILIFNLIPLYPLDGGRIIKSLIYIELGKEKSDYIIGKISFITITILTIISSIAVYYFKNIAIFLICIFLWVIIGQFKRKNSKTLDILR
mgnify:CR=1 FL=1